MPRVPYTGVPEIAPSARPIPSIGVATPPAAFGASTAEATIGLGRTAEHVGDELFQRAMAMQQLANTSEASEAATNFMIEAGDLHAKYGAMQGREAVEAYPKFAASMKDLQAKYAEGLSNPMAKRMFDQESRSTMAKSIFNAAGHAATENKQWSIGAAKARVGVATAQISEDPYDDVGFQGKLRDIQTNTRDYTALETGDDGGDVTKLQVLKNTSNAVRTRIEGIAKKDPGPAGEMLEKYRKGMTEEDFKRAEAAVLLGRHTMESRNQAAKINADLSAQPDPKLPEKTLDERVKEAKDWASTKYPDDPVMGEYVTQAVRNQYAGYKRDVADARVRNLDTMQEALQTNIGGKLPTTPAELFMSDKARGTYLKLDATDRKKVLHALDLNAKDDVAESEATFAKYHQYRGMATSEDPEERAQFLSTFFPAEKDLPRKRRDQLTKLQADVKKGAEADPRVIHGMKVLTDAGIAPRIDQDKEGSLQFRGALQEALDGLRDSGEKPPKTLEEWKKIGATLRTQVPKTGWFSDYRVYEVPVPSEMSAQLKTLYPGITDEQMQREYGKLRFMEAWKETYGKKKAQ